MIIWHTSGARRYLTKHSMCIPGFVTYGYKITYKGILTTNSKTLLKSIKRK